jgi:hypothetical protein
MFGIPWKKLGKVWIFFGKAWNLLGKVGKILAFVRYPRTASGASP